jgi:hypothetical protein
MAEKCSRNPFLDYLSKNNVKNEKILKDKIIGWCFHNQAGLGCELETFKQRMEIMTIGTGKWRAQRHPAGLDDIFVRVDIDFVRLFDHNIDELP